MSTYVLVPGFWLGAWAWQRVADPLRAQGHRVYAVTLTGLADRVHLASPAIGLGTHIDDLVNLITYEDLHDVVLVGHSGGALAAMGAADRIPERISRLVFLESGPMPAGVAQIDTYEPDFREHAERLIDGTGEARVYPFPSWDDLERSGCSLEGLSEADRATIADRATGQPAGTVTEPLTLPGGGCAALPKTLITCSFPLEQIRAMIDAGHPMMAPLGGPEWDLQEMPTGHWPMFSRPEATVSILSSV